MSTWYIWHFWSDSYEELTEVTKETQTKVQFANGSWSNKATQRYLIASSVADLEAKRLEIAQTTLVTCERQLAEARDKYAYVSTVPLSPRDTPLPIPVSTLPRLKPLLEPALSLL